MNILLVFVIAMAFLLTVLIKFKWSASVGLIISACLMGILAGIQPGKLVGLLSEGFGNTMKSNGLIIIFGCIFGEILSASGALEEIAKALLRKFGTKHDYLAVNLLGYIVSIPVYFGSAYVMLAPLINSLQKLTKKKMMGYCNALFVGLLLTHCIVAPTPGPVAVAGELGANLGWFILYGVLVSLPASLICGWLFSNHLNAQEKKDLQEALTADSELLQPNPGNASAKAGFALIALPIVVIVAGSVVSLIAPKESMIYVFFQFFGNQNIALFNSMLVAAYALKKYLLAGPAKKGIMRYIDSSANSVGGILMVIGCGGCFAKVITETGIGDALSAAFSTVHMPILLLGFVIAMIMRAAVGSATVAMMTAVSIVGAASAAQGLSPVLVGLSICAGTVGLTLPTDGAFWRPSQFNGATINETMIITGTTTAAAFVVFAVILLLNTFGGILPGLF